MLAKLKLQSRNCGSYWNLEIHIFRMTMGVRGLLLIIMAWRYGDIELGVGILVMFSFACIDWVSWLVCLLLLVWDRSICFVFKLCC